MQMVTLRLDRVKQTCMYFSKQLECMIYIYDQISMYIYKEAGLEDSLSLLFIEEQLHYY